MKATIWLPRAALFLTLLPATISALANLTCEDGQFGPDCQLLCHCQAGPCNRTTGQCPGPCAQGWSGLACQFGNVALHKPVTASNQWHGTTNTTVDGRRRTTLSSYEKRSQCLGVGGRRITPGRAAAWWQVDLGSQHVIYNISFWHTLYYRRGSEYDHPSYRDPRATLVVRVVNESNNDNNLVGPIRAEWDNSSICNVLSDFRFRVVPIKEVIVPCTRALVGRFVTLEAYYPTRFRESNTPFTLCEVDVLGYKDCPVDGSSGPGCLNDCGCEDRRECTNYGVCRSGCRGLRYGRNCQSTRTVPKLSKATTTETFYSDVLIFNITNLGRYYYVIPTDNKIYNDSLAGEFKFFYQFEKNDDGSWQSSPPSFSMSEGLVHLQVQVNRTTQFRLRIAKLPKINGSFDHLDFRNMNDHYVDGNVVAVSNAITRCGSAAEVVNLDVRSGSTAALVTWDAPATEPNCPISKYKITSNYQLLNSCKFVIADYSYGTYRSNFTSNTNIILKSLHPFANYTIRVAAIVNGTIGRITPKFFSTLSAVPESESEKAEQLSVGNVTSTSAELYRKRKPYENAGVFDCRVINGRFKQYTVKLTDLTWKSYNKSFNFTIPDQEIYNMTGLRPYTEYSLTYAIVNDVAESSFFNGTIFKTKARRPEKPVLRLSTTLRVWLVGAPTARLTEIVGECNKTMSNNDMRTLKLFRNIERNQSAQSQTFPVMTDDEISATISSMNVADSQLVQDQTVFQKTDESESVVKTECRVAVNSDEGPSDWATISFF